MPRHEEGKHGEIEKDIPSPLEAVSQFKMAILEASFGGVKTAGILKSPSTGQIKRPIFSSPEL
jgi:hypothetical protein